MEGVVLQKAIADAGAASRRAAEKLIRAGRVKVNGQKITKLGTRVEVQRDRITINGKPLGHEGSKVYFLLHKSKGVLSTAHDDRGRTTVLDIVKTRERIVPVGRLDVDTTGLLILTNDGELVYELTHPKFEHEKEYEAVVEIPGNWGAGLLKKGLERLRQGVKITTGRTSPAKTRFIKKIGARQYLICIAIHEGRKHQVRQMINAIGASVVSLTRVRMGPIKLGGLKEGAYRQLTPQEIASLKKKNSR
ncbi:MAG: rRNA pseudouridine synthase [Parcubacteria group bacterium]|nr:rRNA pseudouridine synthase [Parcubacteria group bacterium]